MKRFSLIWIALFLAAGLLAQEPDSLPVREFVRGQIYDQFRDEGIPYAHIINQHTATGIIADTSGVFEIRAWPGDTIFISALGYHFDIHPITKRDVDTLFRVPLILRAYTLQEVVIHELDTYDKFKKGFMEVQVETDDYHVPGLPHIQPREVPLLRDENYLKNAGFALNSPVSFLYYNFSKREKNKRLYYQLVQNDRLKEMMNQRFNDTIMVKITGLDYDELGPFKDFCNFQPGVILGLTDYQYYMLLRRKYVEYVGFLNSRED